MKGKFKTVMVSNSININKTNNHLSSQIVGHTKRPVHTTLKIQVLAWDMHTNLMCQLWSILLHLI